MTQRYLPAPTLLIEIRSGRRIWGTKTGVLKNELFCGKLTPCKNDLLYEEKSPNTNIPFLRSLTEGEQFVWDGDEIDER
jgi:hypothetical protein